ncbi:hypothetical protein BDC45DRAFT_493700 [Circinella umbellata]|nr:hypothetical protein BDC45DRAFT_493700 [Circinella umbellata]
MRKKIVILKLFQKVNFVVRTRFYSANKKYKMQVGIMDIIIMMMATKEKSRLPVVTETIMGLLFRYLHLLTLWVTLVLYLVLLTDISSNSITRIHDGLSDGGEIHKDSGRRRWRGYIEGSGCSGGEDTSLHYILAIIRFKYHELYFNSIYIHYHFSTIFFFQNIILIYYCAIYFAL